MTFDQAKMEMITFGYEEKDDAAWKALLARHLPRAGTFEIHCWNEETQWIELALQYGSVAPRDWQYGQVIAGAVTPEFAAMLLNMPKPRDIEIYNKMTPFFNIFLDHTFFSSHYGTEIYISK